MNNKPISNDIDNYTILIEKNRILGDIEYIGYISRRLLEVEERLSISISNFLDAVERKYECNGEKV